MSRETLPPRRYAEQVLGKAVTPEQLDELFELHAAAHPVVRRQEVWSKHLVPNEPGGEQVTVIRTTVEIQSRNPIGAQAPVSVMGNGVAYQNPEDEFNKRLGVTIAFGRALKDLRREVGVF